MLSRVTSVDKDKRTAAGMTDHAIQQLARTLLFGRLLHSSSNAQCLLELVGGAQLKREMQQMSKHCKEQHSRNAEQRF